MTLLLALFFVTADSFVVPARAVYVHGLPGSDRAGQQRVFIAQSRWRSCRGGCKEGTTKRSGNGMAADMCMSAAAASLESVDVSVVLGSNLQVLSQEQQDMATKLVELGQVGLGLCLKFLV